MKKLREYNEKNQIMKTIYLILVVIWMATVFMFSNQESQTSNGTSTQVSTFITKVLNQMKIIDKEQEAEVVEVLNPVIRKLAHYSIYTLGGILIIKYINTYKIKEQNKILYSISIGAIYATSDELHQLFIEGRSAQVSDVMLDTIGIATGVCIFLCIVKIIHKIKYRENTGGSK